jgi:hypothetical protein
MNLLEKLDPMPLKGKYSQYGEDAIAQIVFDHIGTRNKVCVDIGAGEYDGTMSNTRLLEENGWRRIAFDAEAKEGSGVVKAMVTPDNVVGLLGREMCPFDPDFLSLDIDSCDYWVLKSIIRAFRPHIICAEFNGCLDPNIPVSQEYQIGYTWDKTDNYGFSWAAGYELLGKAGYTVFLNQHNTNMWAIKNDRCEFYPPVFNLKKMQYHPHNPNAKFVRV